VLKTLNKAFLMTLFWAASAVSMAAQPSIKLGKIDSQGLSRKQAKQVLQFTLTHERYKLKKPGVFIEDLSNDEGKPSHPGYVDFGLGYLNPKAAAVEYWGLFSVSVASGEVWEMNTCEKFSSPALQGLQEQIRAKTSISDEDERIQRRGLGCTD
jgi:hypothetical protein